MATLVLTAVGTALAGPLGGALGAILGQSADALLFAPKARQGPHLSDLKVQTSSYGDAIPRIYGTMRVAGTVIWATDLIERRQSRSAGKGRPKAIEYSYSASFAVALSARRIAAIGRIWADGRLLRDATGRFAESVRFRSYLGDADQPADPLIASAVGIGKASGFRGIAFAMFEDLDLSAFGNRIPQLSFEVEADAAPVDAGLIGGDLLHGAVVPAGPMVGGYVASAGRVRDALAPLVDFAEIGLQISGGRHVLARPDWADGAGVDGVDSRVARVHGAAALYADEDRRTPLARVPRQIVLRHFDRARDYQTSQQAGDVAGGGEPTRTIEFPGALSPEEAQARVLALARAAVDGRRTVQVRAGFGALTLPVGQVLSMEIADVADRRWRIAERRIESGGVTLTLVRHAEPATPTPAPADGGQAVASSNLPGFSAIVVVLDLPGDGDAVRSSPQRLIAAAGSDPAWRGADLWWAGGVGTEPEPMGRVAGAAALGALEQPLAVPATWLIDWARSIDVILAHDAMTLANATMEAMVAGANLAMIGDEAIQFARATPLGERRWQLDGVLRERGGTAAPDGGHGAGTSFVLLGDAALMSLTDQQSLEVGSVAGAIDWQARGSEILHRTVVPAGQRAMVPLAPVHGRAVRADNGDAVISWVARSRAGARWRDGVDVPAGESMSAWRIRWTDPSSIPREIEVAASPAVFPAGSFAPSAMVTVVQRGDFGVSAPLSITLPI